MPPTTPRLPEADVAVLRRQIQGRVVLPGDEPYDRLRALWLQVVDQRPALVVHAGSTDDVAPAVAFARARGLPFGVMATGHGIAAACDGGLLLRLSELRGVRVDPASRGVHLEPGVTSAGLLAASEPHGLVYPSGQVSSVGVVGYTLGGGIGWMTRHAGAACRAVRSATVVLADGSTVTASAGEHPDLFWALRGGGGNFGVVTSLELPLEPLAEVYGGMLWYPLYEAGRVLTRYRDWAAGLGPETSTALRLLMVPPKPEYPESIRGKVACAVGLCHLDLGTVGELLRPWRAFRPPVFEQLATQPLSGMARYDEASHVDGSPTFGHLEHLEELSDEVLVQLIYLANECIPPLMILEIQQLGGALATPGEADDAMAYTPPRAPYLLHMISPAVKTSLATEAKATKKAFAKLGHLYTGEACYNFLRGDEQRRVPNAFGPDKYRRPQEVKRRYDPANFFRLNLNVRP